jgi:hypothetical protein
MGTDDCALGTRRLVKAAQHSETLLVIAEGEHPHPGYRTEIEWLPIDVEPPEFAVRFCEEPGMWPEVMTPYRSGEFFRVGGRRTTIRVHHAEGIDEVPVEGLDDNLQGFVGVGFGTDEATGFSRNLSFDDAFADALAKLPSLTSQHPDAMATVRVQEVGGLFGGLAGFHHLYVKVRREVDSM